MIRQNIILDTFVYIVDLYKAYSTSTTELKNFVMLRNYNLTNNITQDNNIYLIERDIAKQVVNEIHKNNGNSSTIVFPMPNTKFSSFSCNYNMFSNNFNKWSFSYTNGNDTFGSDIYELYDSSHNNLANIPCDKIRIYHPSNKTTLNAIIHISIFFNDINFHLFCSTTNKLQINVDNEFKINNNTYSEYIEFNIPNIEYLVESENVYYLNDLNIVKMTDMSINTFIKNFNASTNDIDDSYLSFKTLTLPYIITTNSENKNQKEILDIKRKINSSILTTPINITLFPYSNVDTQTNQYILDSDLPANSDTFNIEVKFNIAASLGFNENGVYSIINKFTYPNEHLFTNINEAYINYNFITADTIYKYLTFPYVKITQEEAHNYVNANIPIYINTTNSFTIFNDFDYDTTYKEFYVNTLYNEDYEDDEILDNNILGRGFYIVIATDRNYKNIIFEKYITPDFYKKNGEIFNYGTDNINDIDLNSFIDDYAFELNNLFESWDEIPEFIVLKSIFIDKVLRVKLISNDVVVTKEHFKYLINSTATYRLLNLSNKQSNNIKPINNIADMDTTYFNFIDFINKINCTINKGIDNTKILNNVSTTKIIYKPIFYKVSELQTLKIKANVNQNIGINLSSLMTKVSTFKLIINGQIILESGRNDIYVIFNIMGATITESSGYYTIINENNEYISDGTYILY